MQIFGPFSSSASVTRRIIRFWDACLYGARFPFVTTAQSMEAASSQRWLLRQRSDPFVRRARIESYRCRSAFKLIQLHAQIPGGLLHPGDIVIDCGAAPGSWSQVAASHVAVSSSAKSSKSVSNQSGLVIAFDILDFAPIPSVIIHPQTDLRDCDNCVRLVRESVANHFGFSSMHSLHPMVNVVLSDLAPNASGHKSIDIPAMMDLVSCVLQLAVRVSAPGASLVVKLWYSPEVDAFQQLVSRFYIGGGKQGAKSEFPAVRLIKPEASRKDSAEVYLVARGFHLPQAEPQTVL